MRVRRLSVTDCWGRGQGKIGVQTTDAEHKLASGKPLVVSGRDKMVLVNPSMMALGKRADACYFAPSEVTCVAVNDSHLAVGCESGEVLILKAPSLVKA